MLGFCQNIISVTRYHTLIDYIYHRFLLFFFFTLFHIYYKSPNHLSERCNGTLIEFIHTTFVSPLFLFIYLFPSESLYYFFFLSFFILFYFFTFNLTSPLFFFIYFNWRIIALQYCDGFCHESV